MKYTENKNKTIWASFSVIVYSFKIYGIGKGGAQISFVEHLQKSVNCYRILFFHTTDLSIDKLIFASQNEWWEESEIF